MLGVTCYVMCLPAMSRACGLLQGQRQRGGFLSLGAQARNDQELKRGLFNEYHDPVSAQCDGWGNGLPPLGGSTGMERETEWQKPSQHGPED